jgi:uncharacterized membrane protein
MSELLTELKLSLGWLDVVAIVWFIVIWLGYQWFAGWSVKRGHHSIMSVMGEYRKDWWAQVLEREQRIVDAAILTNLSNSATFFASTTLLILGGLLALMGTSERVIAIVAELPFISRASDTVWEFKILLLLAIFVYAFFKFTWSLRQHNFSSVLVGAAPAHDSDPEKRRDYVIRSARIATFASDNFNYGLRAYYFGLAALTWSLNAWIFMVATVWVALILYMREFRSEALRTLDRSRLVMDPRETPDRRRNDR